MFLMMVRSNGSDDCSDDGEIICRIIKMSKMTIVERLQTVPAPPLAKQ